MNYEELILYLAARIKDFEIPQSLNLKSELPQAIKTELEKYFCTYKEACEIASKLFINLHKPGAIVSCCQRSKIGKKLPGALYIHTSALQQLHPLLRLYESFANRIIVSNKIDEGEVYSEYARKTCGRDG